MRFLGIDYGKKRIGLALSDENGRLAFPEEITSAGERALGRIGEIIRKENVEEIVVGESLDPSGEPNIVMKEIKDFAEKLSAEFFLPVRMEKEFFTSVEARRYDDSGVRPGAKPTAKSSAERADAKAAALILQRYLDKINNKKND